METDKTTLKDLAIFSADEDHTLFNKLDFTQTVNGRAQLRINMSSPLTTIEAIENIQQCVQLIHSKKNNWPKQISNGTLMVIERFFGTAIDSLPTHVTTWDAFTYKLFHGPDFSLVKYSVIHCFDLLKGMSELVQLLPENECPPPLAKLMKNAAAVLSHPSLHAISKFKKMADAPVPLQLQLAQFVRFHFKRQTLELIDVYAQLDAWKSMGLAMDKFSLVFPAFEKSDKPFLEVEGLYHLLLPSPVPYNVELKQHKNFLFLTGANMAGKSTFIRSVGTAVFLAHLGMGVPAGNMKLSMFDGLLSNINIADNIYKGESYFFNEVQRIKSTVLKVNDGRKWLILIDELFKGTNVQDAMKCSSAVIEGFLKIENSLFILSTHLYEIGEDLKKHSNIIFNYFETTVSDGQLNFSYQLKDGISNDRLGYLILQREGVVKMLADL